MIQMWSRPSTDTPMVCPRIQWLGSGFGHSGSTSKRGAVGAPAAAAAARFSSRWLPTPNAMTSDTNNTPIEKWRFIMPRIVAPEQCQ